MNVLDEVLVLPKPVGPKVLRHTQDDLYTDRVGTVCGFARGARGHDREQQLVRVKFADGRYPRDAIWIPRYRLKLYEPTFAVKLNRQARDVGRRWQKKLAALRG